MNILSDKKFFIYPLLLFPPSLITGPFLPDLIISFLTIYFLIFLIINKNIKYLINDFSKIFCIFYIYIVLRSLFSDEILFTLKNTLFYFRFLVFALLLKYILSQNLNLRKIFINIFLLTLIIISVDAFFEQIRNSHWLFDKTSYAESHNNRISGLFDEEYILGGFILSFFPAVVIIYYFQKLRKKYELFLLILLIVFFCYVVIITGERASFIKLLIFVFLAIFFTSIIKSFKIKSITSIIILFSIVFTISFQPKLKDRLIYHSMDLFFQNDQFNRIDRNQPLINVFIDNYKKGNFKPLYFSKEHTDHAIISFKMFYDNKIFGHGVKMFRFKCAENKYYINDRACSTHSHGIVFTFLSELGIIGILFMITIYFYLIKNIIKPTKNKNIDKLILMSILVYLFPLLPSGYFFNNFFSIILYTLVGLFLACKKNYNHN